MKMAPISESPPNVSFPLPSCLPHSWSSSVLAAGAERVELKVSGALFPVQVIQVRLLEFFQTKAKRAHWESNTSRSSSICSVLSGAGRKTGDIKGLGLEKKRNSLSWNLSFYFLLAENQDKYLLCNITDKVQVPYQDGACFPKATVTRVFRDKAWTVRVPTGWEWPSILNRPASQTYNSEKQRQERLFSDATLERGTNKSPSDHRPSPSWRSDLGFDLNRR